MYVRYSETNRGQTALGDCWSTETAKLFWSLTSTACCFKHRTPVPNRLPILNPLNAWGEAMNGMRVVLAGTAHAKKFEGSTFRETWMKWLIFIVPLTEPTLTSCCSFTTLWDKQMSHQKSEITNCVPRGLVHLADYLFGSGNHASWSFSESSTWNLKRMQGIIRNV
ncbi:hypothetical protein BC936DRAFT_145093 [Jimgerdemannia flammicorona]|uniref:Uncharacterized protein n=1 Tax=Jimgerdemannia flammicorona TaxID=994334 RepID=A0A433DAY5_9FUNG|nr:hypothetical protein BC936DRAFT_145093 [Jimgerdemannia flammicorona]